MCLNAYMSISILIVRVFSPMSSFQTGISDSPKVDLGEGVSKSSFHALLIPASHQATEAMPQ